MSIILTYSINEATVSINDSSIADASPEELELRRRELNEITSQAAEKLRDGSESRE